MSVMSEVEQLVQDNGLLIYSGYAPSGATVPYMVHRPLVQAAAGRTPNGHSLGWDNQHSVYCAAGTVEASLNLAQALMALLDGVRVAGAVLATSLGYSGALVEGHYECQVTVQFNQGAIA